MTLRVDVDRTRHGRYVARNARGATLSLSAGGDDDFTPAELLLAALGACSLAVVDLATTRRVEPVRLRVSTTGMVRHEGGTNRLTDLGVAWDAVLPADPVRDPDGARGRSRLRRAIGLAHDRLCTVGRTVEDGTPVTMTGVPEV